MTKLSTPGTIVRSHWLSRPTFGAPSSIHASTQGSSGRKNRNTSSPSSSRLPGVVVRARHHAKMVASSSASTVRGSAMRMLVASSWNVPASERTARQFASVNAPGWPGATSRTLP